MHKTPACCQKIYMFLQNFCIYILILPLYIKSNEIFCPFFNSSFSRILIQSAFHLNNTSLNLKLFTMKSLQLSSLQLHTKLNLLPYTLHLPAVNPFTAVTNQQIPQRKNVLISLSQSLYNRHPHTL
jgi:hypothetical protein